MDLILSFCNAIAKLTRLGVPDPVHFPIAASFRNGATPFTKSAGV
jgi:hypothetical protein